MATSRINHIDEQMEQKISKNCTNKLDKHRIRVISLGKSGHGKSSTGNRILKQKVFSVSSSTSSHTKHCRVGYRTLDDIELVLCDTPGLFDTNSDSDVMKAEIGRAVDMVYPGPHAFLIHFKIGNRFTIEEQQTIERIQEIFGENASKYCILILTGEDNLLHDDETIEGYLQNAAPGLKQLLAQCQNRYIAFNNRAQEEEIDERIRQLLKIIEKMLVDNQTAHYSKEELQRAARLLQEREQAALETQAIESERERQSVREEVCREFALREKAIEEERQKLKEMATASPRESHDGTVQNGPTMFDKVFSILPQMAEAVIRVAIVYSEQRQDLRNNEHQSFYSSTNTFRQSPDDSSSSSSSSEEEKEPSFYSTNTRRTRSSFGDFPVLIDPSSDSD